MIAFKSFSAFYESHWQHPWLLWVAIAAGALFILLRARGTARSFALLLSVLAAVDAWLTSNNIPLIGRMPDALASALSIFFVIAGDLRLFLLQFCLKTDGWDFNSQRVSLAVVFSLVVPVSQQLVSLAFPTETLRSVFLTYELLFIGFLLLHLFLLNDRFRIGKSGRFAQKFALGYYLLWAVSDILILTLNSDTAFLSRTLANLLYYGMMPAVIAEAASLRQD